MRLGTLAMLPSKVAEEACHAAVAWWWADELAVIVRPATGTAAVQASFASEPPPRAELLIRHAPKIAGAVLAVAALWAVASGVRPDAPLDIVGTIAAAAWWSRLVAPERRPSGDGETDAK